MAAVQKVEATVGEDESLFGLGACVSGRMEFGRLEQLAGQLGEERWR